MLQVSSCGPPAVVIHFFIVCFLFAGPPVLLVASDAFLSAFHLGLSVVLDRRFFS
ncbi:hypothetical protein BCR44DRAFT_207096 [Catenaria anguillulae PL171]|uniref:Uncharacterized protein n=1 Tax=Catenaria anguillulae PL171 TaxID=765915 RepID=A0A1Y2HYH9_9FUNG|nr:hypothetical protein BCR44DRAFT_207096 [Catenaria anguillulae PL171]